MSDPGRSCGCGGDRQRASSSSSSLRGGVAGLALPVATLFELASLTAVTNAALWLWLRREPSDHHRVDRRHPGIRHAAADGAAPRHRRRVEPVQRVLSRPDHRGRLAARLGVDVESRGARGVVLRGALLPADAARRRGGGAHGADDGRAPAGDVGSAHAGGRAVGVLRHAADRGPCPPRPRDRGHARARRAARPPVGRHHAGRRGRARTRHAADHRRHRRQRTAAVDRRASAPTRGVTSTRTSA